MWLLAHDLESSNPANDRRYASVGFEAVSRLSGSS
jgi:hypothetical protein